METIRIPIIAGDGTGEDIWNASREIFEEALLQIDGQYEEDRMDTCHCRIEGPRTQRPPAARRNGRCDHRLPTCPERAFDDAGRGRLSQCECLSAPDLRPLCLHEADTLVQGPAKPLEKAGGCRHYNIPGKHRRPLPGNRMAGRD